VRDVTRERYGAKAIYLVLDAEAAPPEVHVTPAQTGQLLAPRARQQQRLQVRPDYGIFDLLYGPEPCRQLLALQAVAAFGLAAGQAKRIKYLQLFLQSASRW
jgi:hypothetical protein